MAFGLRASDSRARGRRPDLDDCTILPPATPLVQRWWRLLNEELDRFDRNPEDRVLLADGHRAILLLPAPTCDGFNQSIEESSAEDGPSSDRQTAIALGQPRGGDGQSIARRTRVPERLCPFASTVSRKPSIAAVNGYAIGVGMGLAPCLRRSPGF